MVYKADSNSSGGLAKVLDRYRIVVVGTKMTSIQNKLPRHSAKHELILAVAFIQIVMVTRTDK
jgi:hypothetical protein